MNLKICDNYDRRQGYKIFNEWQRFSCINNKLSLLFSSIPKSFLPYEAEEIEKALNIRAKEYFDNEEKENSRKVQEGFAILWRYESDEKALRKIKEELDFILNTQDLKEVKLAKLKEFFESWRDFLEQQKNSANKGGVPSE